MINNKARFLTILRKNVNRPGLEDLIVWLEGTDFFTAPASTRYHLACEGGLLEHSLHVYDELAQHTNLETAAVCGLLHDVCKANIYQPSFRNIKNEETGKWEKVPCYTKKDAFPYGHGEKSVFLISRLIPLTDEESMAIRWHMGFTDDAARNNLNAVSEAFHYSPLVWNLHAADMRASLKEDGVRL